MTAKEQARQRAEVIMQVRAGRLTVKQAAAALGISRKTYYQWEGRGLSAMLSQLEEQAPGRPPEPVSAEALALKAKVAELEQKLAVAEQTAEIRAVLRAMDGAAAKKKRK